MYGVLQKAYQYEIVKLKLWFKLNLARKSSHAS